MATVYVSMGRVGIASGGPVAVFQANGVRSETITSSGTAAAGSLVGNGGNKGLSDEVAQIVCATAIYAQVGATASATIGVYVPGGVPVYMSVPAGATVSVIDV